MVARRLKLGVFSWCSGIKEIREMTQGLLESDGGSRYVSHFFTTGALEAHNLCYNREVKPPDLLLVDTVLGPQISYPVWQDLLKIARSQWPKAKIVVITRDVLRHSRYLLDCSVRMGASGYVSLGWEGGIEKIPDLLDRVMDPKHKEFVNWSEHDPNPAARPEDLLEDFQYDMFLLVGLGKTCKQVSTLLQVKDFVYTRSLNESMKHLGLNDWWDIARYSRDYQGFWMDPKEYFKGTGMSQWRRRTGLPLPKKDKNEK